MEIRARYTLIGAFVLAVIGAIFGFVYWLNSGGGLGQRALYRIRYENTVSGLLRGSAVLFNGVRVGEVTALQLEAKSPRQITVTVAIDPQTPVRADTRVGIDFQGLSGAPAVALTGGSPDAPLSPKAAGEPPLLLADPDAGLGLSQAAREVLKKIDAVVATNSEPLRNLIANIDQFAGALARNSNRVDGILAGIERMTGGGTKVPPRIVELAPAASFPGLGRLPAGQLVIAEPASLLSFDTAKLIVRGAEAELPALAQAQFPDTLPKILQVRVVQSFENAGYLRALGRTPEGMTPDFQLLLDIRRFDITAGPKPVAEVAFGAKLLGTNGKVVDARVLKAEAPVSALELKSIGDAIDGAFAKTLSELVVWACAAVVAAEQAPGQKKAATP